MYYRTVIAIAVFSTIAQRAVASPSQDLAQGRSEYQSGNYALAVKTLNFLVHPKEQLGQPEDLVETYVLLGASLVETGKPEDAKTEFEKALQLQPDRELTDKMFSKGAIRVFEETRAELAARDKRIEDAKKLQEQLAQLEKARKSLVFFENRPYSRNFVPFGAGQFQNKQPVRGALFFASEAITLSASAGIWLYLVNTYGLTAKVPLENSANVRRLQQIEVVTGAMFLGLYAWGVIDSLLHYEPVARGKFDESLLPPELRMPAKPAPSKPKKTSLRDRIHFGPMLTPGGVGVGLGWEN